MVDEFSLESDTAQFRSQDRMEWSQLDNLVAGFSDSWLLLGYDVRLRCDLLKRPSYFNQTPTNRDVRPKWVSRTEQLYAQSCSSMGHQADGAIMATQNTSSSDNVFGHELLPVLDQANPETCGPQMRLPMRTRSPKLDVAMTQGNKGLFALVSIDRNEVLIDLNGENYFLSPTRRSLQIGEKKHVFGRDETVGYLNHSCEPNSFLDFSSLCVRALRDIQRGEEVKVNYAATEYEMHDSFRCDCGSSACLQMIRGFKFLTRVQQFELKPYLAPYLLKKLDDEISQDGHHVEK